jgi:hypothetical protein
MDPLDDEFMRLRDTDWSDEPTGDILESYIVNPPFAGPLSGFEVEYDISDSSWGFDTQRSSSQLDDRIGNWPQRLLHVPSMTSYEWTPGHIYGGHVAPKYIAISYTWGRYNIDHSSATVDKRTFRQTNAIEINGIPWIASLPRIHPAHFTVSEFRHLIQQTCRLGAAEDVEFLWLDLACIDQQDGPQKMEEIGRQAGIYRGAQSVFIWLTTARLQELTRVLQSLSASSGK